MVSSYERFITLELQNNFPCNMVQCEVLLALARATKYSLKAHVPRHAVLSRYVPKDKGKVKKALERIVRTGFATKHPTRGEMTFHLTRLGLTIVQKIESKKRISQ